MVARRHHYLPQCYLRGFAKPQKRGRAHHVHVFDRNGKTFTTNIINVATERDFNRVEVEGHSPDAFEQGLAKFEGELGPALVRILKSHSLENQDDRLLLMNLIAMLTIRNPQQRENVRTFHEDTAHLLMEVATASKERWEAEKRRLKAAGYEGEFDVPYEELRKAVLEKAFRIEVPTEGHIGLEMGILEPLLTTLLMRKWLVLLTPRESGGFVTCDSPVCLMFSNPKMRGGFYGPGHGAADTQIVFPVGRWMAIAGAFELEKEGTLVLDENRVAGVNGALVTYADRQVYAADANFIYARQENEKPRLGSSLVNDTVFLTGRERE
jgi:hypothetical protein